MEERRRTVLGAARKGPGPRPYRKLECGRHLKRLMQGYYALTKVGPRLGMKTVWLTSGAPVEIPLSMGLIPQYPENYGALCGARRASLELCRAAEARGYSPDLCSYARTDLGSVFSPEQAPLHGLSRPDVLVACNNICGTVTKWWEHLAHWLGVPCFLLDTPFSDEEPRPPHLIDYAARQVEELIVFLERHTRRRFSERKFHRVARRSREAVQLWNECLDLCTARPAPLGCADRFLAMAPIVTLRGTRVARAFYGALKRETAQRVERGEGAIVDERRRLLWDNIAIWYNIYELNNRFAEGGASFPVDTYTSAWTGTLPEEADACRGVARVYSDIYLNRGMQAKIDIMASMMDRFELDGFVLHSNRSCKPYSLGQLVIKQELTRRTGRPGLVLEADMTDSRHYDGSRVSAQVSAFLEMLE
jgi:benzoyl-CoA reductase/2-hydroxyglutaryl-CoA dehydratase subunit BcrC/BadD/HgdB